MIQKRKLSRGITLMEVLICVGIVSILALLLFPMWKVFLTQAQTSQCLGNIRTYGNALLTYAADNGGLKYWDGLGSSGTATGSPQFNKWLTEGQYIPKNSLRCPLAKGLRGNINDRARFPYAGNTSLCHYYHRLLGIPAPLNRVVLAAEANDWDGFSAASHLNAAIWNGGTPGNEGNEYNVTRYHGSSEKRGLHFFFLDGSAALVFPTDNDWGKEPVKAPLKGVATEGYFFIPSHFANMKDGKLIGQ